MGAARCGVDPHLHEETRGKEDFSMIMIVSKFQSVICDFYLLSLVTLVLQVDVVLNKVNNGGEPWKSSNQSLVCGVESE